jgi:tetratricopeptide (TPR) repeat protein
MAKNQKKEFEKPMTPEMSQMDDEKLNEYIQSLIDNNKFDSIEELNEFISQTIVGKRVDEIIPQKKGPKTNVEKSEDLMYEAYDSDPIKGIKLAEQALELNPENLMALNYIGDYESDDNKSIEIYKNAMEIGARQLGEDYFVKNRGHFWGLHITRPYMTARLNYANALFRMKKFDEAIKEYIQLINLNPNDNQGVRYILSGTLLFRKKYKTYYKLYQKYKNEGTTFWLFDYTLYLFATEGATLNSSLALYEANTANKFIIPYLTLQKKMKSKMDNYYAPGDENEAIYYILNSSEAWLKHPDSFQWLISFAKIKNIEDKIFNSKKKK